jgi:hypothetical protein
MIILLDCFFLKQEKSKIIILYFKFIKLIYLKNVMINQKYFIKIKTVKTIIINFLLSCAYNFI